MGAYIWGHGERVHIFRPSCGYNMPCPSISFSLGFSFGEVSKIKVTFVAFRGGSIQ